MTESLTTAHVCVQPMDCDGAPRYPDYQWLPVQGIVCGGASDRPGTLGFSASFVKHSHVVGDPIVRVFVGVDKTDPARTIAIVRELHSLSNPDSVYNVMTVLQPARALPVAASVSLTANNQLHVSILCHTGDVVVVSTGTPLVTALEKEVLLTPQGLSTVALKAINHSEWESICPVQLTDRCKDSIDQARQDYLTAIREALETENETNPEQKHVRTVGRLFPEGTFTKFDPPLSSIAPITPVYKE